MTNNLTKRFIHLHVHSHYSLLDGLAKIDDLIDRAVELEMPALALTDHGVMYGAIEFYQKAKKVGLKPIIGLEAYVAPRGREKKEAKVDDLRYHITLLAKNLEGYENLLKLSTLSHLEGFYYKPRVDDEILSQYNKGLIVGSGCLQGEIPKLILSKNIKKAKEKIKFYQSIFGKDNFFLEIMPHQNIKEQLIINDALKELSRETGAPLIATADVHYIRPEDAKAHDVLLAVQTRNKINDRERLTMADDVSFKNQKVMVEFFKDVPEAIENTYQIAKEVNLEIDLSKKYLPKFSQEESFDSFSCLKTLALSGLKEKYQKITPEIKKRFEYELSVIQKTGFADYFLIVQDFVSFAKRNGIIVGPGRGSAAGSIISYALDITTIDPLKYKLLFERFLNPERISLPDIDVDFDDQRRDEVINYVKKKYGEERVARIITFGTMAARPSIRDVGRALGIEYSFCDSLAKLVPFGYSLEKSQKEVPEFKNIYIKDQRAKQIIDIAKKLEGIVRHASVHACGVVIAPFDLVKKVPLQRSPQDPQTVITQYEMHSIENLGLLKMDFLGLKNLTLINEAIKGIKENEEKEIKIEDIPLNDKRTFELLQKGETIGVFQLECLTGDTIVSNTTIKKLYERKNQKKRLVSVYLNEGKAHLNQVLDVLATGKRDVYILITENDWYIKSTKDHYFLTESGWKKLEEIKPGDKVLIRSKAKHLIYNTCKMCGRQISGQKEGKSSFCYRCSAKFYRNPSKKESREKIRAAKIRFYQNGGRPWNYGVTVENNEIWKRTAQKISKALRGRTFEEIYGPEKANEMRKKLSLRSRGSNNPMFGKKSPHRKGGYRKDLGHYVRSSWEADFARILKLYNLDYEYEPRTFKLIRANGEILHYTPDFYVPSQNTFYEIKGFLRDLDREKLELFKQQYPQINLVVISSTKFAELALKYKTLINWECPQIPKGFKFVKVKEIKYAGQEMTYDIMMCSPGNNFQANGFIVHNSGGMRRYLKKLKPTKFEDIIAMVALYRPGPMELIPEFITRKEGKKKIEYLHPGLKPILEDTYGVAVFQEQILEIVRDLAGFSLSEADILRKAVGKKIKKLLDEQKEKMIKGMIENKISRQTAEKIWHWIEPFARYGFNRSHATCYAMVAYQTAFLKAHWPEEFIAALLNSEKNDVEKIAFFIKEANRMGIKVLPPNINQSFHNFRVVKEGKEKYIRFGLAAIKNLGSAVIEAIIEEREKNGPFKSIEDFLCRIHHKDLNKKSLESAIKAGVFSGLADRQNLLANLEELLRFNKEFQKSREQKQENLFGDSNFALKPLSLSESRETSLFERLVWEKELLGLYISGHPLDKIKEKSKFKIKDLVGLASNTFIEVIGLIEEIKRVVTRNGQTMLFVKIEDKSHSCEVIVFNNVLSKTYPFWQKHKIVKIQGRLTKKDDSPKIICERVKEIAGLSVAGM